MVALLPPSLPPSEVLSPVTVTCFAAAAEWHRVPLAALASLLKNEGGRVGARSANNNGSYDYGPMQVNTTWADDLARQGVSLKALQNNGCVNAYAGAWVFRQALDQTPNLWLAVGVYHGGPIRASWSDAKRKRVKKYITKTVLNLIDGINLAELIREVNGNTALLAANEARHGWR